MVKGSRAIMASRRSAGRGKPIGKAVAGLFLGVLGTFWTASFIAGIYSFLSCFSLGNDTPNWCNDGSGYVFRHITLPVWIAQMVLAGLVVISREVQVSQATVTSGPREVRPSAEDA
jgi:hypothetical protein